MEVQTFDAAIKVTSHTRITTVVVALVPDNRPLAGRTAGEIVDLEQQLLFHLGAQVRVCRGFVVEADPRLVAISTAGISCEAVWSTAALDVRWMSLRQVEWPLGWRPRMG